MPHTQQLERMSSFQVYYSIYILSLCSCCSCFAFRNSTFCMTVVNNDGLFKLNRFQVSTWGFSLNWKQTFILQGFEPVFLLFVSVVEMFGYGYNVEQLPWAINTVVTLFLFSLQLYSQNPHARPLQTPSCLSPKLNCPPAKKELAPLPSFHNTES